jgi:hypothetical protein
VSNRIVIALLACTACAVEPTPASDEPECARVEGADLGQRVTVDGVTFTGWIAKADGPGQYVGFRLDTTVDFVVKADFNFFISTGAAWQNPFGDSGTLAKAIEYVDVCDVVTTSNGLGRR